MGTPANAATILGGVIPNKEIANLLADACRDVNDSSGAMASGTLTTNDSGSVYSNSQAAAYAVTLPSPSTANIGLKYTFVVTASAANAQTITAGASALVGTIVNDVTSVIPATGTTLQFEASAAVGDWAEFTCISSSLYLVRAVTSTAGKITIS